MEKGQGQSAGGQGHWTGAPISELVAEISGQVAGVSELAAWVGRLIIRISGLVAGISELVARVGGLMAKA